MKAVADAGPVIHLSWIARLDVLRGVFEQTFIPLAVREEVLSVPNRTPGVDEIRQAIDQKHLLVMPLPGTQVTLPGFTALGAGEREAILLFEELGADLLITDDALARQAAAVRGIKTTGTLGVLKAAQAKGLIPAVVPLALELRRRGQCISENLIQELLRDEGSG